MPEPPPPPSLPPPGWYADPSGVHGSRWWDGTQWTGHVRAAGPGDEPPPAPGAADDRGDAAGLPLGGSARSRRLAWVLGGLLVVGLVATAVIGVRNGLQPGTDGAPLGQVRSDAPVPAPLDPAEVERRRREAGCRVTVDGEPLEDRTHLGGDAPPSDVLYPDRPAHSGQHYGQVLPLPDGVADAPIDERAVLHNMEHGSVAVWFDDGRVGRGAVANWRARAEELGFTSPQGGGVFASPMPDDLDDPPALALRAWGVAMDCEQFDPVVADAFLADHWGSHGAAPEASLSPYPEGSLSFEDG